MSPESLLTDELRSAIGLETEPTVIEIDNTLIRRLAEAVEDSNPLWTDAAKAKRGPHGVLVAPPSVLATSMFAGVSPLVKLDAILPPRALDGGGEYEIYQPIKSGDTITITSRLADIVERQSRLGPMLVLNTEITWRNQREEVVAKATTSVIKY